jgi:sugar O-acyltransferase (sialic acid O-acetyltransferase NeuD family)
MLKKIILVGGGGHCVSCIDVIESTCKYEIHGILDIPEKVGTKVLDYTIIGTDSDIEQYALKNFCFLVTAGHIKNSETRQKLYGLIKQANGLVESIIASSAIVSKYSFIGEGCIIMHNAFVNAGAQLGINCIVNSNALIEHDVQVGDHTHISTMATVNGGCVIGHKTFIGSNAVINQGVKIAEEVIIGSGSVVNGNILLPGKYAGNPYKKLEE